MKSSQLRGCSEDESSSSSLSSESLHLEDTAETRAFAIDSGNCSFDTSTESLDKHDVTDDELDIETTRRDFPQKESVDAHGLNQLKFRRVAVMSAFLLSMGGTGSLSYLYLIGILPELEDQWLCALILVALYILPMVAVMWYEFGCRFVIEKLRKTATNNTAIVNSLFPENVRSRMITEESRRIKQEQKRGRSSSGSRRGNDSSEREKQGSMESLGEIVSLGSRGKRKQRRKDKRRLHRAGRRLDNFVSSPANQTIETVATEATFASVAESPPDESDEGLIPQDILTNKPIADFFPHCTVLFADIVGFTAWSSVRDPTAVFTLLESLYSCFDGIARRLRVFKVETIGDCYVAATGLPEPMENHAIIMAQFARTCMSKMMQIVRALEKHLGPDTGDLSMRFGLHSGPVTAGVMRGEKSRFQLFGDTVNTAARIESTGMRDKIHLSASTAEQLIQAGKPNWVEPRDTKVEAKGKGKLQTYWLVMSASSASKSNNDRKLLSGNNSASSLKLSGAYSDDEGSGSFDGHQSASGGVNGLVAMFEKVEKLNTLGERTRRQADYTVKVMTQILKKIVAQRWGANAMSAPLNPTPLELQRFLDMEAALLSNITSPLNEISEAIDFASFLNVTKLPNPEKVKLPKIVLDQLEDFVTTIASMYQNHAFHCWEHASHVTISLTKLYSRLASSSKRNSHEKTVAAHKQWNRRMPKGLSKEVSEINNSPSYGISNDPVTEFALVFAAMIHDVDHPGISNAKVVKEQAAVAQKYGKKSPIEQHSLGVALSVFQRPAYQELRRYVYSSEKEMKRFRQLVITFVMATDIMDRDAAKEREKRWDRTFSSKKNSADPETVNQRATLVLETMMQAANIAHCTQHWNVFTKWNKRLFQEMCEAYKTGRQNGQKDPADFWYQGELAFFADTVIPLGCKLHESGAFGDDAEEFVEYAKSNRRDWETKGRDIINEYLSDLRGMNTTKHSSNHSTSSVSLWSSEGSLKFKPPYTALKVTKPAVASHGNSSSPVTSVSKPSSSVAARWPPPPKKTS